MQDIIPMFDDFLDTIWDFDESWYNARKSESEAKNEGEKLSSENLG